MYWLLLTQQQPIIRPYRYHYVIGDAFYNVYIIQIARETPKEDIKKLETLFAFYSTFFSMIGSNVWQVDKVTILKGYFLLGIKRGEETVNKTGKHVKGVENITNTIESGLKRDARIRL